MLSIFIPQDTLEDIVIDNMASEMEPEDQDVWFKIFTKQEFIYVSSWDEKKYLSQEDPLFLLNKSYGVKIEDATEYINTIPDHPESVTRYWNGIFLLNISEDDAAAIQRDYGVICQSVDSMDASVLMDPDLRFSPKKGEKDYSWDFMLQGINAKHIPSNHLILIDRYLFADEDEIEMSLSNIFNMMDAMLPRQSLKCPYLITLIIGQQESGDGVGLSQVSHEVYDLVPRLKRPYPIHVEVIYLTYMSGLYTSTHNRCVLTNYTITQVEHQLKAFDDKGKSTCLQTIQPQGLFSNSGLNGYCDSPHKTHHDIMKALYNNLMWWVKNYLTPKSSYTFNGKKTNIKEKYGVKNNRLITNESNL